MKDNKKQAYFIIAVGLKWAAQLGTDRAEAKKFVDAFYETEKKYSTKDDIK